MRILFLVTRLDRPSTRFRVLPMQPYFAARGHTLEVAALPKGLFARLQFYRRLPDYDVIGVQQRLLSSFELRLLRPHCRRLVYDIDDAVMYDGRGRRGGRRQRRFRAIARAADLVVCGNRYLAEEASPPARHVALIPTAVDTERFHPRFRPESADTVRIGWTGSRSTNPYLNELFPTIARLRGNVRLKVLSNDTAGLDFAQLGEIAHEFVAWTPENEVSETASFDIGLMPLPDDPWTRGKCGCKALQYMALGIPAVCSPVGVNCDIVEHGRNGYLVARSEEWFAILSDLIEDARTRAMIGEAGRRSVEERFALQIQGERLVEAVEQLAAERRQAGSGARAG